MTYFGRLAQRFGPPASPRAPVAPTPGAGANSAGGSFDVAGLESIVEVPASGAPTSTAQPMAEPPGGQAAPPSSATPIAGQQERLRSHDDRLAPASSPHDVARATTASAPRDWVALDSPMSSESLPRRPEPAAPLDPQEILHDVAATKGAPIASDVFRGTADAAPASRAQPSRIAAEPAVDTLDSEVEVVPRAESRLATQTSKPRSGSGPAQETSRRHPVWPSADTEADQLSAAASRGRNERDTTAGRAGAPLAAAASRGNSVEVRIGAVTLQVHAPLQAAVPPAPARPAFAPHRHYLRIW